MKKLIKQRSPISKVIVNKQVCRVYLQRPPIFSNGHRATVPRMTTIYKTRISNHLSASPKMGKPRRTKTCASHRETLNREKGLTKVTKYLNQVTEVIILTSCCHRSEKRLRTHQTLSFQPSQLNKCQHPSNNLSIREPQATRSIWVSTTTMITNRCGQISPKTPLASKKMR